MPTRPTHTTCAQTPQLLCTPPPGPHTLPRVRNCTRQVRAHLLNSDYLGKHVPRTLRDRLTSRAPMDREAALCAAVTTVDVLFAARSAYDVWVTTLRGALDYMRGYVGLPARLPSLFSTLYSHHGIDPVQDDPHSVLYSTAFQTHANGWYGGTATFVWNAADAAHGSGVDMNWLKARGCPGVPIPGQSQAQMLDSWCAHNTPNATPMPITYLYVHCIRLYVPAHASAHASIPTESLTLNQSSSVQAYSRQSQSIYTPSSARI